MGRGVCIQGVFRGRERTIVKGMGFILTEFEWGGGNGCMEMMVRDDWCMKILLALY